MPALKNPRHEAFAQALARGRSAAARPMGQVGFKPHLANAATLARKKRWLSGASQWNAAVFA